MTTAHRPTWKAAVGRADEGGWSAGGASSTAVSALDVPAHTTLKFRKGAQSTANDRNAILKRSLLELEQTEQNSKKKKSSIPNIRRPLDERAEEEARVKLLKQTAEVDEVKLKQKGYDDSDIDDDDDDDDDGGGGGGGDEDASDLDNDNNNDDSDLDAGSSSSSDDSDSDEDDDEAALQAELAKIRAEREQAKQKAQAQQDAEETAKMEEAALLGNPLLLNPGIGGSDTTSASSAAANKRRWNEDVVFRNQAKGEPAPKKRFINDTVRNDFHRRFLNKFIR